MASCPKVTSYRFLRLGCRADQHELFSTSYVRSNKKRSAKLLRCFPHCCPDHKERSYCGCSLHLLVTFESADAATTARRNDGLVVCARFEAAVSVVEPGMGDIVTAMLPGAIVALPASALLPTGAKTEESDWVCAEKASETYQHQFPEDAILYVLNNNRSPQWCYAYESGSTKAQREMRHELAVYMFLLDPLRDSNVQNSREDDAPLPAVQLATVIHRQASSPFSMVSYRRQSNIRRPTSMASGEQVPNRREDIHDAVRSQRDSAPALPLIPSAVFTTEEPRARSAATQQSRLDNDSEHLSSDFEDANSEASLADPDPCESADTNYEIDVMTARSDDSELNSPSALERMSLGRAFCCHICCEPLTLSSHPLEHKTMERLQSLLVLQLFIRFTPLEEFSFYIDKVDFCIQRQWLSGLLPYNQGSSLEVPSTWTPDHRMVSRTTSAFSLERLASRGPQTNTMSATGLARKRKVLRSCADILLETFSSTRIQQMMAWGVDQRVDDQEGEPSHQSPVESCEQFSRLIEDLFTEVTQLLTATPSGSENLHFDHRAADVYNDRGYASIPELVDDVLSVIYADPEFQSLRSSVSDLLLRKHEVLETSVQRFFWSFLRQQQLESSRRGGDETERHARNLPCSYENRKPEPVPTRPHLENSESARCAWDQRWFLDPTSLSLHPLADTSRSLGDRPTSSEPSLLSVLAAIRMFACMQVQFDGVQLTLTSVMADTIPTLPVTEFVLDGLTHTLESLPNGLSPVVGAALFTGMQCDVYEYEGHVSGDGSSVELLLFFFSLHQARSNNPFDDTETWSSRIESVSSGGQCRLRLSLTDLGASGEKGLSVFAEVSASSDCSRLQQPTGHDFDCHSDPCLNLATEAHAVYICFGA